MTLEERTRRIREQFAAAVLELDGIEDSHDHEPEMVAKFPAVTMLYVGSQADDSEIGTHADIAHTWDVFVYVSIAHGGWRDGQHSIPGLVATLALLSKTNKKLPDPDGVPSCDYWRLDDPLEQPEFVVEDVATAHMIKRLRLTAWSRDEA